MYCRPHNDEFQFYSVYNANADPYRYHYHYPNILQPISFYLLLFLMILFQIVCRIFSFFTYVI